MKICLNIIKHHVSLKNINMQTLDYKTPES